MSTELVHISASSELFTTLGFDNHQADDTTASDLAAALDVLGAYSLDGEFAPPSEPQPPAPAVTQSRSPTSPRHMISPRQSPRSLSKPDIIENSIITTTSTNPPRNRGSNSTKRHARNGP